MPASQSVAEIRTETGLLVLGVDTCGSTGSVALARLEGASANLLGMKELAGRSYSATLVAAVGGLLAEHGTKLTDVGAMVVVSGPGSFTGVRVGLSAVKGMAEPGQIPVVAVSRLAVLAATAEVTSAALDAHRHEVFLRLAGADGSAQELLAGAEELAGLAQSPDQSLDLGADLEPTKVALCDNEAASIVGSAWLGAELVRCEAPTAWDAIQICVPEIVAGKFADLALLDGHYLRRSDAEIFGDDAASAKVRHA
jgi:tRNA threonylcarbamoyladenosine biosynthesis protein TsaB